MKQSLQQETVIINQQTVTVRDGSATAETNLMAQENKLLKIKQWAAKIFGKAPGETAACPFTNH